MPISRETFVDQVSRDYDQIAVDGLSFPTSRLYDDYIIRALPPTCGMIVDAGCGVGGLTSRLAGIADRVLAIDISQGSLDVAMAQIDMRNVDFQRTSVEQLSTCVPKHSCSAIIANRVLHHCHDLPRVLQDLVDLLEPSGKLVILDLDSTGNGRSLMGRLMTRWLYRTTLLVKAALHGRLRQRYRDLKQEQLVYSSDAWQQHLAHEPDFSWRHIWDVMCAIPGLTLSKQRINWQFHLLTAERRADETPHEDLSASSSTANSEKKRVFLSHAAKDSPLATDLKELLERGIGDVIFCTSVPGSIRTGEKFAEYIRTRIADSTLVVFLVTRAFYESPFCMSEAGAAWVLSSNVHPLLVGEDFDDRTPVFCGTQQSKLDGDGALAELRGAVLNAVNSDDPFTHDSGLSRQWHRDAQQFSEKARAHTRRASLLSRYARHTNAIIEPNIEDCRKYIDSFFLDTPGEIWLFDTDLGAFVNERPFKELYKSLILPNQNILAVKMLLRDSVLDHLISSEHIDACGAIAKNLGWNDTGFDDDLMREYGNKLQFRLMSMFPDVSLQHQILNQHKDGNAKFDPTEKEREHGAIQSDLGLFTSNECYIFYVHSDGSVSSMSDARTNAYVRTAACVHRRLEYGGSPSDVRVTISANRTFAEKKTETPALEKFISAEQLAQFAVLFNGRDVTTDWEPIGRGPTMTWRPVEQLLRAFPVIPSGTSVREFDWASVE